ncbi:hypothetical protein PR202_ga18476 [Eleusine coracana subsp. coracana]|uniref:PA domain-containing protein n=1 Tax=Eleusine coracana subsp. coracana TaxID=191504 RepID=A0AAV5CRJ2_ELECO|nr:hypothetical protein PR202_ga18476 [Eleusine coracana subsp. coracana]
MKRRNGVMISSLFLYVTVCLIAQLGAANVVLMGNNLTLSFDDIEANFAPGVKGTGVNGVVYTAEPLNACTPLTTKAFKGPPSPFALIIRGGCPFDDKVRNAQDAGFKAAIVYDNENSGVLVSKFHAACVDLWLTSWRTFCPVCKRDARNGVSDIPASETTPLLASAARLPSQSSSFRSSVAVSPPRAISRHPSTQSVSRAYSVSSTPYSLNPLRSYTNSPTIGGVGCICNGGDIFVIVVLTLEVEVVVDGASFSHRRRRARGSRIYYPRYMSSESNATSLVKVVVGDATGHGRRAMSDELQGARWGKKRSEMSRPPRRAACARDGRWRRRPGEARARSRGRRRRGAGRWSGLRRRR